MFGGTFDPPHIGHVAVAKDVADLLRLDRVLWVPAGDPPHKLQSAVSEANVRLEMARVAAQGDARFEVLDMEVRREGPSYTVDTLRALRAELGAGAALFLILGVDQLEAFDAWRLPEEITRLATLAVMDREGESARTVQVDALAGAPRVGVDGLEARSKPPAVVFVPVRRVDVSSTEVRDRVRRGGDISELVPPAVSTIVERERLYRS